MLRDSGEPGDGTRSLVSSVDDPSSEPNEQNESLVGRRLGQFRVTRFLDRGGMGEVYLARDERLGRVVALKVIRSRRHSPDRIQRFRDEAQLTARLRHPNVVAIHDRGDSDEGPFIAYEYLDGESLRARMKRRSMSTVEVIEILRCVAAGLEHAHRQGVLHRDLKPSNVMLPTDGRPRIVDFGLAMRTWDEGGSRRIGTPTIMAPEQWRVREKLTTAVDIWALGVISYELLSGVLPHDPPAPGHEDEWPGEALDLGPLAEVGPELRALVAACLRPDPESRPTAADVLAELDAMRPTRGAGGRPPCPFLGLRPFNETHAGLFFGRNDEIDAFRERLEYACQLPVVGASGTGKSSFLRAGVIPRLEASGDWLTLVMRPGPRPLHTLAGLVMARLHPGVRPEPSEVEKLVAQFAEQPTRAGLALVRLATSANRRVLLFVDQLEEVFTQCSSEEERTAFLAALAESAKDPSEPIRVTFTVRDDFVPRAGALLSGRAVTVLSELSLDRLRQVILEPLEQAQGTLVPPELADRMAADALAASSPLPLLQFACLRMWEQRDPKTNALTEASYERMGGVGGALADHGDTVLAGLTASQGPIAQRLLTSLVNPDRTRRLIRQEQLDERELTVARALESARLIVRRRSSDDTWCFELSHEALASEWGTLDTLIKKAGARHHALQLLDGGARVWDARGRSDAYTWPPSSFEELGTRIASDDEDLPSTSAAFVRASLAVADRQLRATRRRRRLVALGGSTLVIVALAFVLRGRAELILASGDIGVVELEFRPFDWDAVRGAPVAASMSGLPDFSFRAHAPDATRTPTQFLEVEELGEGVFRLEVSSRPLVLQIDGRAKVGDDCGPSTVPLQGLPGYADRDGPTRRIVIPFPTCDASFVDMTEIPRGPFVFGGRGEPPAPEGVELDERAVVDLPTYRIGTYEFSNARAAPFFELEAITGIRPPQYPDLPELALAGRPDAPVAAVDAFTAEALCAYYGLRLPSHHEWVKAYRGGTHFDAEGRRTNPNPERLYPHGKESSTGMNLLDTDDGYVATATVGAFPDGISPYGVHDLAGNVEEWLATPGAAGPRLRELRGGSWSTRTELGLHTAVVANSRFAQLFELSTGFRCAWSEPQR